jgi:hypothetical protein
MAPGVAQLELDEALRLLAAAAGAGDFGAVRGALAQAEAALKACELEARLCEEPGKREALRATSRAKRAALDELRRGTLLGRGGAAGAAEGGERARMAALTAKAQAQNDQLAQARRTLAETEQVAQGVTDDLGRQKETIAATQRKVDNVKGEMGYANQLLTSMKSWWQLSSIQDPKTEK